MDRILALIERYAGKLSNWAWDKRWKERDKKEDWVKGIVNGRSENAHTIRISLYCGSF